MSRRSCPSPVVSFDTGGTMRGRQMCDADTTSPSLTQQSSPHSPRHTSGASDPAGASGEIEPAVDVDRLAGDVAVPRDRDHELGDLVDGAEAADGNSVAARPQVAAHHV